MDVRHWDRNRLLTALAAALLVAVSGYWAWQLTVPAVEVEGIQVRRGASRAQPVAPALVAPLVRVLSPGAVATDVQVLGVLAGSHAPLALLSVDGAPAQAYATGQRLGPSTRVAEIGAEVVTLEQAGQLRALPVPALPPLAGQGIVRADAATTR
ncbi:MAG: hypothetical protein ACREPC_01255 [Stenotrophomonas sp.]|uniref:hypothetical protein n=1 Tax=Stenotrophomonas sp. TaxID=69392 RepID=UPI003D6D355A